MIYLASQNLGFTSTTDALLTTVAWNDACINHGIENGRTSRHLYGSCTATQLYGTASCIDGRCAILFQGGEPFQMHVGVSQATTSLMESIQHGARTATIKMSLIRIPREKHSQVWWGTHFVIEVIPEPDLS